MPTTEIATPDQTPTVHELTIRIARLLEGSFSDVAVQGEVSQWTVAASGHIYFSLKDDKALISCVLWRGRRLPHKVETGMQVVVTGRITVYPPRGQYQLDCLSIVPRGVGDLQMRLEAIKQKLASEGLFDSQRKRPLPLFPRRIGIVTSKSGAAIRDILTTLERRMPGVEVVFRPALVQGAGAAEDVAEAIRQLDRIGRCDVMIVGRGGGSLEDLWAFNEEVVARAIAACSVPIVSAVGHEIDYTIADLVADVRAATPTAAAELVVRDRSELLPSIQRTLDRMGRALVSRLQHGKQALAAALGSRGLSRPIDIVRRSGQRVDELSFRASLAMRTCVDRNGARLQLAEATLRALNPENILSRGYAIVERSGVPVPRAADLRMGENVDILMRDGRREAVVTDDSVRS